MADGTERPSRWLPMQDRVDLAHLGKLGEECGELAAIVSRCIIQGIDGSDPETGKPNRLALEEEIADVFAMADLAIERFDLDGERLQARADRKRAMKRAWHAMLEPERPAREETVRVSGYDLRARHSDRVDLAIAHELGLRGLDLVDVLSSEHVPATDEVAFRVLAREAA